MSNVNNKKSNIWVQVGELGLGSPKLDGYDGYITIGRFRRMTKGSSSDAMGVRVTAYGPTRSEFTGSRVMVHSEVIWGKESFDAKAVNNLGSLGAYVTEAPDTSLVQGAVERARNIIEAAVATAANNNLLALAGSL